MTITPEQSRAARAMLDWSQDILEGRAGVAKKTIADFERGALIPYKRTLNDIQTAFEAAGITFIAENGGGAGVRMSEAVPRLARTRISRFDRLATLIVRYRDRDYRVVVSTDVLDDLDRTSPDAEQALAHHLNLILMRAANAIDAGRAGDTGQLVLTKADFTDVG